VIAENRFGKDHAPIKPRPEARMLTYLEKTRRFLWLFVELGFLTILSVILIYLILGENSGVFVTSVADNVVKFAGDVPTPSLIGIGVILAIVTMVMQRLR
jgi:hypothetical protein